MGVKISTFNQINRPR